MTELILNSTEHKVDVNKLRYEFKSPIRFDNSFISLTQAVFYNFFHNVKQNYEMKVKKDNTFYNISFIDSMLEVEDVNKIINDELIRHKLLTEDDPPIISIIADIKTFKIIILVERGYELHLDDNFSRMLGFSYKILKKGLQRSDLTPQINRINYLKIYSNIIDNENNPYYLSNVFIKSNVCELTVYNENNKYKKQKIINDVFNYIEIEIFDEENEKIEMTDYFSVSLYIHQIYMTELEKLFKDIQNQLNNESKKYTKLKVCKYSFEVSKVAILSISTGLSFISIFAILSMILIPILDSVKHTLNVDYRINITKLKKDLLKELLNYKSTTYKHLNNKNSKQNIIAKTSMNTKTDKNREAFKNTIVSFISSGVME